MFRIAGRGDYPRFPSPPRPALLKKAIHLWKSGHSTVTELQRAIQRARVEVLAEYVAAGVDIAWDGLIISDGPIHEFCRAVSGIDTVTNRIVGTSLISNSDEKSETDSDSEVGGVFLPDHQTFTDATYALPPRVVGSVAWVRPIVLDTYCFLKERSPIEIRPELPGAFTLARLCEPGIYDGRENELIVAFFGVLIREIEGLAAAGAQTVMISDPMMGLEDGDWALFDQYAPLLRGGSGVKLFLAGAGGILSQLDSIIRSGFLGIAIETASPDAIGGDSLSKLQESEITLELGAFNHRRNWTEEADDIASYLEQWGQAYDPSLIWVSAGGRLGRLSREEAFIKLQTLASGVEVARREMARRESG